MVSGMTEARAVVDRIVAATNAHDLDSLVECFAPDYVNETPAHPQRGFRGREQVRRNWGSIFAGIPDVTTRVTGTVADGNRIWTEWDMRGTRRDGVAHAMAGVVIFAVAGDQVTSARFYLEPLESTSGGVDDAVKRFTSAQ
jgi:ketosteroid isomerase-like protein